MSAILKVLLIGAGGRLGSHVDGLLEGSMDVQVVARLKRGEVTQKRLAGSGAQVGVEMTAAGNGLAHGLEMLRAGVRPVVATSGVSPEQTEELNALALQLQLGGLVVPNFSLGICLLQRAVEEMARLYPLAEIVETHHLNKLDAPSGTSLATRERMLQARPQQTAPESIPIHSLRLPGVLANQEVTFGGEGELLRVTHETYGPSAYDQGILASLKFATHASGVGHGIEIAFKNRL